MFLSLSKLHPAIFPIINWSIWWEWSNCHQYESRFHIRIDLLMISSVPCSVSNNPQVHWAVTLSMKIFASLFKKIVEENKNPCENWADFYYDINSIKRLKKKMQIVLKSGNLTRDLCKIRARIWHYQIKKAEIGRKDRKLLWLTFDWNLSLFVKLCTMLCTVESYPTYSLMKAPTSSRFLLNTCKYQFLWYINRLSFLYTLIHCVCCRFLWWNWCFGNHFTNSGAWKFWQNLSAIIFK